MTRAPFAFGKTDEAFSRTPPKVFDTTLGWRFENPRMAARFPLLSMGETAEEVAAKWGIGARGAGRASRSPRRRRRPPRSPRARSTARSCRCRCPQKKGETVLFAKDESPRGDTTLEALAKLAARLPQGRHRHRGQQLAASTTARRRVLVVSEEVVKAHGLEPLARVVAHATAGVHPNLMGEGPDPGRQEGAGAGGLDA